MNYLAYSKKAREHIKASVKKKLLRDSGFCCSICGKIPIVFHHIEEWAEKFSNNEKYLIPICDECHRHIHGKGGCLFSKKQLYEFKANPKKPQILKDDLPLGRNKNYSFFVGSNFVANGEKASLIGLPGNHKLLSIDTSSGILKLSVLVGLKEEHPVYLIRDNELQVDTQNLWKMEYSGNALKIWEKRNNKKVVFIDLIIKPDVIIVRGMNAKFNGKLFRVYKPRVLQKRKIEEITSWVKECEKKYREDSVEIDRRPQFMEPFNGMDIDKIIKKFQKDNLKHELEFLLRKKMSKIFKGNPLAYCRALDSIFDKSVVFRRKQRDVPADSSERLATMFEMIKKIKRKYKQEFEELEDIVTEYGGMVLSGSLVL